MNKKTWILLMVLVVIIGGFFYWWLSQPVDTEEPEEKSQPPTLFAKEDYKIEVREDGKYIVVEKVGLTAKVPEGWKIEIEGSDIPEPEYWVNLSSPDAEVKDILTKGCGISIMAGISAENVKQTTNNIILVQKHPDIKPEEISYIYKDYTFEVIGIDNHQALKWIAPEKPIIGQGLGVNIPVSDEKLISFDTRFLPDYKEKCFPIWEEFLKNIIIE
jgi:hypothetical protein